MYLLLRAFPAKPFFPLLPTVTFPFCILHLATRLVPFFFSFFYYFPPLKATVLFLKSDDVSYIRSTVQFPLTLISRSPPCCYWINFPRSKLIFSRPTAMVGRRKNRAAAQPAARTPSISTRSGRTAQGKFIQVGAIGPISDPHV